MIIENRSEKFRNKLFTFKQSLGLLLVKGQQLTGSLADLSKSVLDPPDLTLVAETILANDFQLLVESGLLEGPSGGDISLAVYRGYAAVHHDEELEPANIRH